MLNSTISDVAREALRKFEFDLCHGIILEVRSIIAQGNFSQLPVDAVVNTVLFFICFRMSQIQNPL